MMMFSTSIKMSFSMKPMTTAVITINTFKNNNQTSFKNSTGVNLDYKNIYQRLLTKLKDHSSNRVNSTTNKPVPQQWGNSWMFLTSKILIIFVDSNVTIQHQTYLGNIRPGATNENNNLNILNKARNSSNRQSSNCKPQSSFK